MARHSAQSLGHPRSISFEYCALKFSQEPVKFFQVLSGLFPAPACNTDVVTARELVLLLPRDNFVAPIDFLSYKIASLSAVRGALEVMILKLGYG